MLLYIHHKQDYFLASAKGAIAIIWIELNAVAMYVSAVSVIEVTNLLGLISWVGAKLLFLKLGEVHHLLQQSISGPDRLLAARLVRFQREHISVALLILQADNVFGKLFLLYLVAMVPLSISLTLATFFVRSASVEEKLYSLIMLIPIQWCFVFMHLMVAMFPERIHHPIKLLFRLLCTGRFRVGSRQHLQMSHYLEAFHTHAPYGITYGHLGLITMFSLVKFAKSYTEFIIFAEQLFRNAGWI